MDGIAGQVINLMSNDVSRFDFSTGYVNDLFKGPLEMFIFGYFIYREIGAYGLIGIGCLISFMPLQSKCAGMHNIINGSTVKLEIV